MELTTVKFLTTVSIRIQSVSWKWNISCRLPLCKAEIIFYTNLGFIFQEVVTVYRDKHDSLEPKGNLIHYEIKFLS